VTRANSNRMVRAFGPCSAMYAYEHSRAKREKRQNATWMPLCPLQGELSAEQPSTTTRAHSEVTLVTAAA